MQVLGTSVTIPYVIRRGNCNRAYFEKQANLRRTHAQPLQQKFLPVLKPGLSLSPSLLRDKSFVCKATGKISWVDENVLKMLRPYAKLSRLDTYGLAIRLHSWPAFWSIMLATKPGALPDLKLFGLYYLMSFLIFASGCVSNDLADINYDRKPISCSCLPFKSHWEFNLAILTSDS
ncbi:4-hydroxybenzoate polyprenyltransferase, mitochondrial-like isoform X1 [Carex rostrata]